MMAMMLIRRLRIELEPDEVKCFSKYKEKYGYSTLEEAVKAAALRSLPKRKRWRKEDE